MIKRRCCDDCDVYVLFGDTGIVVLSEDEVIELSGELPTIAADIMQRRANEETDEKYDLCIHN